MIKPVIISRSAHACQTGDWRAELKDAFTQPRDLFRYLDLDPQLLSGSVSAARGFRLLVPRSYASLMRTGDPDDPLLRQVLPLDAELMEQPGFILDPVGDRAATQTPGLLQKYRGRALIIATGACAIHCRYCFRRHFPYSDHRGRKDEWNTIAQHLAEDTDINEIILSGGDPLMLDDEALSDLLSTLEGIGHLRRLRIHTRMPIVLPGRVTPDLCSRLEGSRLQVVVVIHANHPAEIGPQTASPLRRLREQGGQLLNQSVLLRGVNDRIETLRDLSEALFSQAVLPYYLHQLDRALGAAHFAVSDQRASQLMDDLRCRLPGYLVPRLVREEAEAPYKTPIAYTSHGHTARTGQGQGEGDRVTEPDSD